MRAHDKNLSLFLTSAELLTLLNPLFIQDKLYEIAEDLHFAPPFPPGLIAGLPIPSASSSPPSGIGQTIASASECHHKATQS